MAGEFAKQFLLKTVSVLSTSDVRYEGKLYLIDDQACQIALQSVRCLGTEGRRTATGHEIPASEQTYEYIMFKPENVKKLFTSGSEREQDLTKSILEPLQRIKKEDSDKAELAGGEPDRSKGGSRDSKARDRRRGPGSGGRGRYDARRGGGRSDGYRRERRGGYRNNYGSADGFVAAAGVSGDPNHPGPLSDFYRGSYAGDFNDYGSVRYFHEQSQRRDQARFDGGYPRSYRGGGGGYDQPGRYYDGPSHGPPMGGGRGRRDFGPGPSGGGGRYYPGGPPGRRDGGGYAYYAGQRGRGRGRGGFRYGGGGRGGFRGGAGRRRFGRAGTGSFLNEYNLRGDEIRVGGSEFDFAKAREKAEKELAIVEDAGSGDAKVEAGPISVTAGPESEFYSEGLMDKGKEKDSAGAEAKEESKAEIKRTPDEAQKIRQQIMAQNTATFGTVADGYRARSFQYRNRGVNRGGGSAGGYPFRGGRGGPSPYYERRGAGRGRGYYNNSRYHRRSNGYLPYSDQSGGPSTGKSGPKKSDPKESRDSGKSGHGSSPANSGGSKGSSSGAPTSKVWVRKD